MATYQPPGRTGLSPCQSSRGLCSQVVRTFAKVNQIKFQAQPTEALQSLSWVLSISHPVGLAIQPLAAGFWERTLPLVSPDFFRLAELPRLIELKIYLGLQVAGNNRFSPASSALLEALVYITILGHSPSVPWAPPGPMQLPVPLDFRNGWAVCLTRMAATSLHYRVVSPMRARVMPVPSLDLKRDSLTDCCLLSRLLLLLFHCVVFQCWSQPRALTVRDKRTVCKTQSNPWLSHIC